MIKRLFIFCLMLVSLISQAQEQVSEPSMADTFRSEGKIFIVIGVMAIVFISIVMYLFVIEKRLKRLEDEIKNKK